MTPAPIPNRIEFEKSWISGGALSGGGHENVVADFDLRPVPATTQGGGMAIVLPESFGRYRILKPLGEGGMGAVFLAKDTQLDRLVALKVPKLEESGTADSECSQAIFPRGSFGGHAQPPQHLPDP